MRNDERIKEKRAELAALEAEAWVAASVVAAVAALAAVAAAEAASALAADTLEARPGLEEEA